MLTCHPTRRSRCRPCRLPCLKWVPCDTQGTFHEVCQQHGAGPIAHAAAPTQLTLTSIMLELSCKQLALHVAISRSSTEKPRHCQPFTYCRATSLPGRRRRATPLGLGTCWLRSRRTRWMQLLAVLTASELDGVLQKQGYCSAGCIWVIKSMVPWVLHVAGRNLSRMKQALQNL